MIHHFQISMFSIFYKYCLLAATEKFSIEIYTARNHKNTYIQVCTIPCCCVEAFETTKVKNIACAK